MSININVHGNSNILGDRERCRLEEQQRRKLLRLAQVREQSKTMAANVRQRVDDEQRRQIAIIDRIKADEIRAWKQKHALHSPDKGALGVATRIGEAHAAAVRETVAEQEVRRQQEQNRRMAAKRGREALAKMEQNKAAQQQAKTCGKRTLPARGKSTSTTTKPKVISHPKGPIAKHVSTQVGSSILEVNCDANNACVASANICLNSSSGSDMSVHDLCAPTVNVHIDQVDLTSDTLSSSLEIETRAKQLSQPLPLVLHKDIPSKRPDISNAHGDSVQHIVPVSPIREATELIRKRRSQQAQQPVNWFVPSADGASAAVDQAQPQNPTTNAWTAGLRTFDKPAALPRVATTRPVAADNPVGPQGVQLRQRNPSPSKPSAANARAVGVDKPIGSRGIQLRQRNPSPSKQSAVTARPATSENTFGPRGVQMRHRNQSPNKHGQAPRKRFDTSPAKSLGTNRRQDLEATTITSRAPFVPRFNEPTSTLSQQAQGASLRASGPRHGTETEMDTPKVLFYDHANRFTKEYTPPDVVQVDDVDPVAPNAMEAAADEIQRDNELAEQHLERRRIAEYRGQVALEREKTRRDYERMSNQLSDLDKQPELARVFAPVNENYTEERLQQMANDRQAQINQMGGGTQSKPARIDDASSSSSSGVNVASANVNRVTNNRPPPPDDSDSSVLLVDYVERRTSELENSVQQAAALPTEKTDKLKALLDRINVQREQLLRELQPNRKSTANASKPSGASKESLAAIFQSVQSIEREKRKVLAPNVGSQNKENDADALSQERAKLQQLEKDVRHKERRVEQKLRQMFAEEQRREQAKEKLPSTKPHGDDSQSKTERTKNRITADGAPVQIIIQVNGGTKLDKQIYPTQTSPLGHQQAATQTAHSSIVPLAHTRPKTVYPKTPAKSAPAVQISSETADGSSTSTAYQSLPKTIRTELSTALGPPTKPAPKTSASANRAPLQTALGQYITRLLGMSRASLDQLNVDSSSSIETPSSSIINVSANITTGNDRDTDLIDEQRLDKLQRFIDDNRSFISELEESLHAQPAGANEEENMKSVEALWLKTLAKQEAHMKRLKAESKRLKEALREKEIEVERVRQGDGAIKPILKKPLSPKKVQVIVDKPAAKSSSSSANAESYNARIADLTEKIEQIRREKQRLMENTYSSMGSNGTEPGQNSTDYLDVGQRPSADASQNSSRGSDLVSLADDGKASANKPLQESVHIGLSRDSGINVVSRPLTASDAISPDPKSSATDKVAPHNEYTVHSTRTVCNTVETAVQPVKRPRPPVTISRFAPHIDELDLPHELSTIAEVDTPAATARTLIERQQFTSQVTATTQDKDQHLTDLRRLLDISAGTRDKLRIRSFTAAAPLEETNLTLDDDQSGMKSNVAPQIRSFPSHSRYAADDASGMLGADTLLTVTVDQEKSMVRNESAGQVNGALIRPFPSHQDYALGVSGLCTSASIKAALDENGAGQTELEDDEEDAVDSDEIFPDIEAELRRRNMMVPPFETLSSTSSDGNGAAVPKIVPPRKSTASKPDHASLSVSSSDNLEAEMQKIGLHWASSMIKKNREAQMVGDPLAGTSSSTDDRSARVDLPQPQREQPSAAASAASQPPPPNSNESLNSTTGSHRGQPLNLKDFLARELLKRSNNSLSSSVHDESSMASHFLRSLLGSSNGTDASSVRDRQRTAASERHRTSTPVRQRTDTTTGSSPRPASKLSPSQGRQLFSGESGMSSVRDSSATSSNSNGMKSSVDAQKQK